MRYHVSLLVSLISQLCWAQEDTSYQPVIGERAAALPYPHLPVPRGDHPHRGGGGIHQHGHSSNKELSISLMHVAEDLKKFRIDVESRLDDMFKVLEEMKKEQQQLTNLMTVLAFGGGGSFRGKRSTDDYAAPVHTEYYEPQYTTTESPAYAPSPPAYAPGPPAYDSYTPKVTHSTEKPCPMGTCNQCPMGDCSNTHRDIFDELPGTVSKRTLFASRSLPGYSGNAMGSYSSGGYSGYTPTSNPSSYSSRGYSSYTPTTDPPSYSSGRYSSYTNDPPSYSTARPLQYDASFYQASHTAEEDIEELEYEEYVL